MTQARSVLPTDVLALLPMRGRAYKNEAWPRERLGALQDRRLSPATALEQVLPLLNPSGKRRGWVSVQGQYLQGLVGARKRGGNQAWEIDCLLEPDDRHEALSSVIERAVADLGESGVEKLFLRLAKNTGLLHLLLNAGFVVYLEETVYAREAAPPNADSESLFRPVVPADRYPLYRLYCGTTPEAVRRHEAATYAEWQAAQEVRWLKGGLERVCEREGRIEAFVRAAELPQAVLVDIIAASDDCARAPALVSVAAATLNPAKPVYVLCPSSSALTVPLESAGFEPVRQFVSLMKRTVRPLPLPKITPAVAKPAVSA